MSRTPLETYILEQGADDWLPLLGIDGKVRLLTGDESPPEKRGELVAESLSRLVTEGLVTLGTVTREHGFAPFASPDVQAQVRGAYAEYGSPDWGFSFWTLNTDAGDAVADD